MENFKTIPRPILVSTNANPPTILLFYFLLGTWLVLVGSSVGRRKQGLCSMGDISPCLHNLFSLGIASFVGIALRE